MPGAPEDALFHCTKYGGLKDRNLSLATKCQSASIVRVKFWKRLKKQAFPAIITFVRKETNLPECGEQQGENAPQAAHCRGVLRTNFYQKGRNTNMKKLALFLALCLLVQAIGLTAFAEEPADIPETVLTEEAVSEEEALVEEEPAKEEIAEEEAAEPEAEPEKDPEEKDFITGDINGSGIIDVTDITELSLALLGDSELSAARQKAADVDGDGAVTLADLARLRQYLSKKTDSLR